jgi:hypothetical protein
MAHPEVKSLTPASRPSVQSTVPGHLEMMCGEHKVRNAAGEQFDQIAGEPPETRRELPGLAHCGPLDGGIVQTPIFIWCPGFGEGQGFESPQLTKQFRT